MTQTLDQRRAKHAWDAVHDVVKQYSSEEDGKRNSDEKARKYGNQAKKLPMRIMAAGLGQALAFLNAKDYAPKLLCDISDWVLEKCNNPNSEKEKLAKNALITSIVNGTSDDLRRWTDETLAYLKWLNRFAEAEGLTDGEEQ